MPERMSQIRTRGQRAESHLGFMCQIPSAGRVIGIVAGLVFLACLSLNCFAINYHFDAADASDAIDSRSKKSASSRSLRLVHSSPRSTALSEAIYQNTPGNSQGQPEGLSWDVDASSTPTTPAPSGWSALTGWGQIYQEAGAPVSPNNATDTVQVQDYRVYVHLTSGAWVELQSQASPGLGGAHYVADFSTNASIPMTQSTSGGVTTFGAPPSGYNDHIYANGAASLPAGTVDGVFVEAQMKTNDASANLVAQLGADWWRSTSASYAGTNVNNTAVGLNDWTKLTTSWQTLYYTSFSAAQLTADPPPGLRSGP